MNKDYEFNPEDWQGRRKDQVESSYKIMAWTILFFIIWIIGACAFNFWIKPMIGT